MTQLEVHKEYRITWGPKQSLVIGLGITEPV